MVWGIEGGGGELHVTGWRSDRHSSEWGNQRSEWSNFQRLTGAMKKQGYGEEVTSYSKGDFSSGDHRESP